MVINNNEFLSHIINEHSSDETPIQIVDLDIIRQKLDIFQDNFDNKNIFYSIKANSSVKILKYFRNQGISFDASSIYEIDTLLHIGVKPHRIGFGNTIKKKKDVMLAYKKGVRQFTTDSIEDIRHIAACGKEIEITLRIVLRPYGDAKWPLNKKFGAVLEDARGIFKYAGEHNLKLNGFSFHVGSQQLTIDSWEKALDSVSDYIELANEYNLKISKINLGGGFPAQYVEESGELIDYMTSIKNHVIEPNNQFEFSVEPGRSLVGDAGIIVTEVVLITTRNGVRWIYLDVGKYNGIISSINEAIKYRIEDTHTGNRSPVVLAGPTCDSSDILYENYKYQLSDELKVGDKIYILSTGAYTRDYSSINFNGLPPLKFKVIDRSL